MTDEPRKRRKLSALKSGLVEIDLRVAKPAPEQGDPVERERHAFYDSALWRHKVRPHKAAHDPLCQACKFEGRNVPMWAVDHWHPISTGGHRTSASNLVSLCEHHHNVKTKAEQLGRPVPFQIVASNLTD